MRRFSLLILLFIITSSLYALDGFFAGLGVEANANTRKGAAAGGNLSFGADLAPQFALGLKAGYSNNFDTVSCIEPALFFRWYLPLQDVTGPFVQAEAGASIFIEESESFPAFLGGLAAGWRFTFGERFYFEPSVRGGYPFAWAVGITAGILIPGAER